MSHTTILIVVDSQVVPSESSLLLHWCDIGQSYKENVDFWIVV